MEAGLGGLMDKGREGTHQPTETPAAPDQTKVSQKNFSFASAARVGGVGLGWVGLGWVGLGWTLPALGRQTPEGMGPPEAAQPSMKSQTPRGGGSVRPSMWPFMFSRMTALCLLG